MDDNIIEVDFREVRKGFEYIVHHTLKGRGSVAKSERHDFELVGSEFGLEGCLVDILRVNPNLMVTRREVELSEVFSALQMIQNFINPMKGIYRSFTVIPFRPR